MSESQNHPFALGHIPLQLSILTHPGSQVDYLLRIYHFLTGIFGCLVRQNILGVKSGLFFPFIGFRPRRKHHITQIHLRFLIFRMTPVMQVKTEISALHRWERNGFLIPVAGRSRINRLQVTYLLIIYSIFRNFQLSQIRLFDESLSNEFLRRFSRYIHGAATAFTPCTYAIGNTTCYEIISKIKVYEHGMPRFLWGDCRQFPAFAKQGFNGQSCQVGRQLRVAGLVCFIKSFMNRKSQHRYVRKGLAVRFR